MNQFLLVLCGLPASGKSALADSIGAALNHNVDIVRTDEWRGADYYTDWQPEKERDVRKAALERVENLTEQGRSVIHDDTNYYQSMRHDLFEIAMKRSCVFAVVHVSTPLEVSIQWNRDRGNSQIGEDVIRKIAERLDRPGGRYLWDQPIAVVNMATADRDEASRLIVDILEDLSPAKKPRPVRVTLLQGEQIDFHTREIVSEFLSKHPELRTNKEVTLTRRAVLARAIEGGMSIGAAGNLLKEKLEELLAPKQ
jgi:O-phosphoseryl-tRNA(Sec) kinase